MSDRNPNSAQGRLLVLTPGLGAVSTTFMAGVELVRRGLGQPVGSWTQLAPLRESDGRDGKPVRDALPLAGLSDLVFSGWDMHGEDALTVAERSAVIERAHLEPVRDFLRGIKPYPAVHDPATVRRLEPRDIVRATSRREQADTLRSNIKDALRRTGASRAVAVFLASTEVRQEPTAAHQNLKAFEKGLDANEPSITPTQLYAYACLKEDVPFANGTPNLAAEVPALQELAHERSVPVAGKDLKTGQTLLKTVLAPGFKARMLGVSGWFSTNILGNRDGEVLDDRDAFRSKETTKKGVLETILDPKKYPQLYGDIHHKVEINYYRPRGDNKEGWDNIDIFGWLNYPMQIKVNFLCRDSILAAPLVLDIALLMDLAKRSGQRGIQEWMSFFFKAPIMPAGKVAENDLFAQLALLEATLRPLAR